MTLLHETAGLIDAATGTRLAGSALRREIDRRAAVLPRGDGLLMLAAAWTLPAVLDYLAALAAHRPVALFDPALPAAEAHDLVARFQPDAFLGAPADAAPAGFHAVESGWTATTAGTRTHPDLAVLLATSGSTGKPQLVRLSRSAVTANAAAIAEALALTPDDVGLTPMPLHFGYGLSVLNSHLRAGATTILTTDNVVTDGFWRAADAYAATTFAAVPHVYDLLDRMRWSSDRHPTLRMLTHSGGRMHPELWRRLATTMARAGGRYHAMYGQTEATARLAILPAADALTRIGSVGLAVPGSALSIETGHGETTAAGASGEVVFRGPAVMMGYADCAADLVAGDLLGGVLRTGDLGHFDDDGYLYLSGRLKRIAKVYGYRINLDDAERIAGLHSTQPVAALADGDHLLLCVAGATAGEQLAELGRRVAAGLHLNHHGVRVVAVDRLPLLSTGKTDYTTLLREVGQAS